MNAPPPIESLTANSSNVWSDLCTDRSQISNRRDLVSLLEASASHQPFLERVELYESINALLQTGKNDRFVLYCPLYLIPDSSWYRRYDSRIDSFIESYLASWTRLLGVLDAKADFTDGDIPEEYSESWVVCQAAQLGPILLSRKLATRQSFAKHILYQHHQTNLIELDQSVPLSQAVAAILDDRTDYSVMSKKRAEWFRRNRRDKLIQSMARHLGEMLLTASECPTDLSHDATSVLIAAIGMLVENGCVHLRDQLFKLVEDPTQRSIAIRTLCRLHSVGECSLEKLASLGIRYPNLGGPHFQHLTDFSKQEQVVATIKNNPALFESCFPVCITYGSQLKGYAQPSSDTDMAILVRPTATLSSTQISEILGDPVQYWLEETDCLRIVDRPDPLAGSKFDIQVLFNGAWTGDSETFAYLAKNLLLPCAKENSEHLLRALEHDILQYRLLHHGYETYHMTTTATFFDDGYRKMASKLYASNVLIP